MFIYKKNSGINKKEDLNPGLYQGCAAIYADSTFSCSVLMAEFRPVTAEHVSFIELFFCDKDGFFEYQNLVMLQNGFWRSSSGKVSRQLTKLLPDEISDYRVCRNMTLALQIVERGSQDEDSYYLH